MLPADIKELIARLDPGSFTAFVEGLLAAEAGRLQMPPTSFVMSDALTENDEGLDARLTDVPGAPPDGPASAIPAGAVGLQLKASRRKQPSAFGLPVELRKEGPKRLLTENGAYVLVSSQDLNPAQRQALEVALAEEAAKVLQEAAITGVAARTSVWDALTLAGMCQIHPGPAIESGLVDFGQALSLPELLESLRAADRPFQSDTARDQAVDRLRERGLAALDDPLLMSLHGDPGAGKTRTVAHAFDTDDLRELVLYINGTEGLQVLLTRLLRNSTSRGILFADEIDDHDAAAALQRLSGLQGRWRIVSVTSRTDRRSIAEGGRNIVLPPLDPDATRRLVEQYSGLPDLLARMVAEVAAGFPELALRLADELRADPGLDLVRLARLPHPEEVLRRALGDEQVREHLAPIALFTSVGFEDEQRYQLEAVADAFGLDPADVERHCEAEVERRRFVSRAGRYRLVSPLLVAIWLATDLIERTPGFENRIFALPEPLQDAFVRQLDYFGPDAPHLPAALGRVIRDQRFRRPEGFSGAAGRLLRASAAIIPTQVAGAINELLQAATPEDLRLIPRRDLVWTLQILLWWPETWETAVEGLFLLAQHENENWANNATGEFPTAFSLLLSGSAVPYRDRAEWLERRIAEASPEQLTLLVSGAAAGLKTHHSRTRVGFRGGGEPTDWEPQTDEEYVEARRTAWRLLLAIRDRSETDERQPFTERLASALRVAYKSALAAEVDANLRARTWSAQERASLASGLRDVLQYEEMGAQLRAQVQELHDWLVGENLNEKLTIIVGTSVWDLHASSDTIHDVPPLLIEVADQLVELHDEGLQHALEVGHDLEQQDTRFTLFRLLSQRLGPERVGTAALARADWPAVSAALSVADAANEGEWATRVLRVLADREPVRVPELLAFVDLNPERLDLALTLVETGRASGTALGRLLYGARITALDEENAVRVLAAVRASGSVEAALGMLDQWLNEQRQRSDAVAEIAGALALEAVTGGGATMTDFYVKQLIEADVIAPAALLRIWEQRMINRSGLVEELDEVLTERLLRDPTTAAPRIFDLVRRRGASDTSFGLFSSTGLALLSRLAAATSAAAVAVELLGWPEPDLRWALHHMNWGGAEPEPLVREFLLSDRLAELEDEASVCFFNTLGVVTGPYYLALERELERARAWRAALAGTGAERWANELIEKYKADIVWHREREQEENLRYR
jgi:hypothetical protein